MSIIPLPLPQYHPRHQEDLFWYKYESDGALGRKSNQGAIEARLEGASGSYGAFDLEINSQLWAAVEEVTNRASFRASGRIKRIELTFASLKTPSKKWKHTLCTPQQVLAAIYWTPPHKGLEAFEAFANLIVFSELAREKFLSLKTTKMSFTEWLVLLSQRRLGFYDQKTKLRSKPKATNGEIATVIGITRECQLLLKDALKEYVKASNLYRGS